MDCSPPGSSIHGIFQIRILEWIAISSSRGSSQSGYWAIISCVSCISGVPAESSGKPWKGSYNAQYSICCLQPHKTWKTGQSDFVAVIPGKLYSHTVLPKSTAETKWRRSSCFSWKIRRLRKTQNLERSSSWNHQGQEDNQSISVIQNPWPINSHLFGSNNPAKHYFSLYANMASAEKVDLNIHLYPISYFGIEILLAS